MVHFPADYSHELYGSLHKNIVNVILFGLLANNLLFKDCYYSILGSKHIDKSLPNGRNNSSSHLL